ncbi:MAG: nitric oxide reductase F protein [Rhodobacterales bacterium CG18_big_fil_WC_8_21_14_2_50_71_9]|nr:MAG: nitric oxide reductase F protein [Rhodobacterales bacterium CG18_big_fil_WC_8_21_14_2_50_71_9]PJA59711.1 MAG: nitric oxide reductase F protein [Rhodobacterales bacterium CG_4_9_14_3_um_filter_71_31]
MTQAKPLIRAWALLVALSLATTALTALIGDGAPHPALAGAVLALAGLKASVILRRYLGLAAAPLWRKGFETVLAALLLTLFAVWLIPSL